ncbi:MAG: hypothetical protein ABIK86_07070, partial [candidate division WOR-3 bacterium]
MSVFVKNRGQQNAICRGFWCRAWPLLRIGSRALVIMALAGAALYYGCGRVAPDPFWEPSPEDTVGIREAIEANKSLFKIGLSELQMIMIDTALPGSTKSILAGEIKGNPFKPRFRCDSFQHVFYDTAYDLEYRFAAVLDTLGKETTCTVTYAETIPGEFLMHAFRMTDSLRESLFFPNPGETLRLPYYDSLLKPCNVVIRKPLEAVSTGGCVLRKKAGKWELWKLSGGTRFYAPNPDDAPYFARCVLAAGGGRLDTVLLRPDTLHYGIQRFYPHADTSTGGIYSYTQRDTIRLASLLSTLG